MYNARVKHVAHVHGIAEIEYALEANMSQEDRQQMKNEITEHKYMMRTLIAEHQLAIAEMKKHKGVTDTTIDCLIMWDKLSRCKEYEYSERYNYIHALTLVQKKVSHK